MNTIAIQRVRALILLVSLLVLFAAPLSADSGSDNSAAICTGASE